MNDETKNRLLKAIELAEQIMKSSSTDEIKGKFRQGMALVENADSQKDDQLADEDGDGTGTEKAG